MENISFELGQAVVCTAKTWESLEFLREARNDEIYPTYGVTYTIESIWVIPGTTDVYFTFVELQNPLRYPAINTARKVLRTPVVFDARYFRPLIPSQLNDLLLGAGIAAL